MPAQWVFPEEDQPPATIEEGLEKKRQILEEIVSAERVYVNNLRSIKQVGCTTLPHFLIKQNYYGPLHRLQRESKTKLTEEELNTIFHCIDDLFSIHVELFDEVDSALEVFPEKSIGAIFLKKVFFLLFLVCVEPPFPSVARIQI